MVTLPVTTPLAAISELLGEWHTRRHERGCEADLLPAPIGEQVLISSDGFEAEFYAGLERSGEIVKLQHLDTLRLAVFGSISEGDSDLPEQWSARVSGAFESAEDGRFEISLTQNGRARVSIDGEVVLDGFEDPPPPASVNSSWVWAARV